jgi:hypothetical protein
MKAVGVFRTLAEALAILGAASESDDSTGA